MNSQYSASVIKFYTMNVIDAGSLSQKLEEKWRMACGCEPERAASPWLFVFKIIRDIRGIGDARFLLASFN
jgi:hypothetical protein